MNTEPPEDRACPICGAWYCTDHLAAPAPQVETTAPVAPIAPSARVVLVGNGPSVLRASFGTAIDAFDEIVRFNAFKIRGFESHVGTRTTLWSTFGRGMVPADPDQRPDRIVFIHGAKSQPAYLPRVLFRLPPGFYNEARSIIYHQSTVAAPAREHLLPSSGFLIALWFLEIIQSHAIHLIGFDHFAKEQSKQHHYWLPQAFGKPKEHDGDAEAAWLRTRYPGRVFYLDSQPISA